LQLSVDMRGRLYLQWQHRRQLRLRHLIGRFLRLLHRLPGGTGLQDHHCRATWQLLAAVPQRLTGRCCCRITSREQLRVAAQGIDLRPDFRDPPALDAEDVDPSPGRRAAGGRPVAPWQWERTSLIGVRGPRQSWVDRRTVAVKRSLMEVPHV
jgi:hypothetical protein